MPTTELFVLTVSFKVGSGKDSLDLPETFVVPATSEKDARDTLNQLFKTAPAIVTGGSPRFIMPLGGKGKYSIIDVKPFTRK